MFLHSRDVGSSPVIFEYFFFFVLFFDLLIYLSLFPMHNWIHVFELACVYVTNTAPFIIIISLHIINSLHVEYF